MDLFDRMMAEAHATLTLASAADGVEIRPGRERELVDLALTAGVTAALSVMRDDDECEGNGDSPPDAK